MARSSGSAPFYATIRALRADPCRLSCPNWPPLFDRRASFDSLQLRYSTPIIEAQVARSQPGAARLVGILFGAGLQRSASKPDWVPSTSTCSCSSRRRLWRSSRSRPQVAHLKLGIFGSGGAVAGREPLLGRTAERTSLLQHNPDIRIQYLALSVWRMLTRAAHRERCRLSYGRFWAVPVCPPLLSLGSRCSKSSESAP